VDAGEGRRLGRKLIKRSSIKVLPVLLTVIALNLPFGDDLPLDEIIEKIYQRNGRQSDELLSYICTGTSVYQEYLSNGEQEKIIHLTRRLYSKSENKNYDEYLEMSLNGTVLGPAEMAEQIEEWNRRGKKRGATNMPLRPASDSLYDYYLMTDTVWNNKPMYRIGFNARPGFGNVINGIAYVDRDYDIVVRIEASPPKLPGVIKMMKMIYHYAPVNGFILPDSFCFEMKIKVKFLINFYDRYIKLTDAYSDYQLNIDIPDSLFDN
jgi:hypothetical protein